MSRRQDRANGLLRQELGQLLSRELSDPTIPLLTSVTGVDTSADLRYARVTVSVMGSPEEKAAALSSLRRAAGFVRKELARRLSLRYTPELWFSIDESMEEEAHLQEIIDRLAIQSIPDRELED